MLRILFCNLGPNRARFRWPAQRATVKFAASELGELSQAIGAALVALYTSKDG